MRKHEEAEALLYRVYLQEKVLGMESPDTLRSMHNSQRIFKHQRKYEEAEVLMHKTLTLHQKVLGKGRTQRRLTP